MFEIGLSAIQRKAALPASQISFTTAGTYTWTCPEGVTSVCCVVIGAGAYSRFTSGYYEGGNGGALRYQNNIPVVPGTVYNITVGSSSINTDLPPHRSTAFNMFAGNLSDATPLTAAIRGGDGGGGYNGSGTAGGGGAGAWVGGNGPGTQNPYGGSGATLYGTMTPIGTMTAAGIHGGGGGNKGMAGAVGGVRIIWGDGRAFPSSQVQDK